jgi:hypothetical protein
VLVCGSMTGKLAGAGAMSSTGEVYAVGAKQVEVPNNDHGTKVLVVKFSASGQLLGSVEFGSFGNNGGPNEAVSVAIRPYGRVSVLGFGRVEGQPVNTDVYDGRLALFDFSENTPKRAKMVRLNLPIQGDRPSILAADSMNNSYVTGSTSGSLRGQGFFGCSKRPVAHQVQRRRRPGLDKPIWCSRSRFSREGARR